METDLEKAEKRCEQAVAEFREAAEEFAKCRAYGNYTMVLIKKS